MSRRKPNVDTTNDPEYWEEILRQEGLSMDAGVSPLVRYVGDLQELSDLEEILSQDLACGGGRKVRPSGAKPE